jgi:hypothetical protein
MLMLAAAAVVAVLPGRRSRRAARAGLGLYAAVVSVAAAGAASESRTEAPGVAVVLATMHLSWGLGFLAGCARHGPPLKGIGRALRGPVD